MAMIADLIGLLDKRRFSMRVSLGNLVNKGIKEKNKWDRNGELVRRWATERAEAYSCIRSEGGASWLLEAPLTDIMTKMDIIPQHPPNTIEDRRGRFAIRHPREAIAEMVENSRICLACVRSQEADHCTEPVCESINKG